MARTYIWREGLKKVSDVLSCCLQVMVKRVDHSKQEAKVFSKGSLLGPGIFCFKQGPNSICLL